MTIADVRRLLAGFTVDSVHERLGDEAWLALARNEPTPALRRTSSGDLLDTLIRLFLLHETVPAGSVPHSSALEDLDLIQSRSDGISSPVELRPYGDEAHDWWVVCDHTPGFDGRRSPVRADFVLGISEASTSLARLTHRAPVSSVLDLGTGCGVQSLHASTHAARVVATDVNPRAVELAGLTAALSDVDVDVRSGSFYEPVAGERFDLITSNPPFVVSPPDGERLVYRETDFALDGAVHHLVSGAADHLEPGGWCQVLAAWCTIEGESWQERMRTWIEPTGLDAWVVRREELDLSSYTEIWLADAGLAGDSRHRERHARWLDWFAAHDVTAMNFGWINLRRADRARPVTRLEDLFQPLDGPVGDAVLAWADAVDALDGIDPLDHTWRLADDVVQETRGAVGAEDPATIVVRQTTGVCRARRVDTIEAALLGSSDGELTARQILDAVAHLLDRDADELRQDYASTVGELVVEGFLRP